MRYTDRRRRGTNNGSFLGMPPTGKSIEIAGIDMIRFRDGQMAEHWAQMDMLGMMAQLGLAPAPDAAPAWIGVSARMRHAVMMIATLVANVGA